MRAVVARRLKQGGMTPTPCHSSPGQESRRKKWGDRREKGDMIGGKRGGGRRREEGIRLGGGKKAGGRRRQPAQRHARVRMQAGRLPEAVAGFRSALAAAKSSSGGGKTAASPTWCWAWPRCYQSARLARLSLLACLLQLCPLAVTSPPTLLFFMKKASKVGQFGEGGEGRREGATGGERNRRE